MSISTRRVAVAASLIAVALTACGGSSPPDTRSKEPSGATIDVVNIAYSPDSVEVGKGDEVVWTNKDEGVRHTVTSGIPGDNGVPGVSKGSPSKPDGVFDGDLPEASSTFRFTFTETGTYAYFCQVHPSMVGEITVR